MTNSIIRYLDEAPDLDMPMSTARRLIKSANQSKSESLRRRQVANNFPIARGRPQPRQGFLSTEMMRLIYTQSEVVRACVDSIIELVCEIEWTIRPKDPDKAKFLKRTNPVAWVDQQRRIEWLKDFFQKPNAVETYDTFHRRVIRDLLIYDAGCYEIVTADYPNGQRLPIELGAIAGDSIQIETEDSGLPCKYHQSYNVLHPVEFDPLDIAYLMMNPNSWSCYGMSPIETAYVSIAADLNANRYNNAYFESGGIPPALLAVLGVSDQQFRSIMGQMRQTKADNPHNIMAFRGQRAPDGQAQEAFQYIPLTHNHNDMQFTQLVNLCLQRICMAYKTSPSQIGFTESLPGGIGNGVADSQDSSYKSKAIAPVLKKLSECHTVDVVQDICGWHDLEFAYISKNTPEQQAEYQRDFQEFQQGVMTANEFREKYDKGDPVDWGNFPVNQYPYFQSPEQKMQQQQQMMMAAQQPQPGEEGGDSGGGGGQPPQQEPKPPKNLQKSIIIHF